MLEIEIAGLAEHERDPVSKAFVGRHEDRNWGLLAQRIGLSRRLSHRSQKRRQGTVEQSLPSVLVDTTVRIDRAKLVQSW